MKYREFTDAVLEKIGEVDWKLLGRLQKKYKKEFILECIEKAKHNIRPLSKTGKIIYLTKICAMESESSDLTKQTQKVDIDTSSFNLLGED